MPAFTTSLSRITKALANNGMLYANSFIDQQRLEIAARVVRNPRSFTLQSWPQSHTLYQQAFASQQALFSAALIARLLFCRATPSLAQQVVDSELLTRHIEHHPNHLYDGLIIHIDLDADRVSVGTFEESAALAFPADPGSIRDLAATLLNAQLPPSRVNPPVFPLFHPFFTKTQKRRELALKSCYIHLRVLFFKPRPLAGSAQNQDSLLS